MSIAYGSFGWTPETFWKATFSDFHAALDYHSGRLVERRKRKKHNKLLDAVKRMEEQQKERAASK